jgi:hypothetical protein
MGMRILKTEAGAWIKGKLGIKYPRIYHHQASENFRDWVKRIQGDGYAVGLITNNHFRMPPGSQIMAELAVEMRKRLEKYAHEVKTQGLSWVRATGSDGRTKSALPTGNVGMHLFQTKVRDSILAAPSWTRVLHWEMFNPIDATEEDEMYQILAGNKVIYGKWVRSVHIFRKIRDVWDKRNCPVPPISIVTTD